MSVGTGGETMLEFKNSKGKKVMELDDEGKQKVTDPDYFNKIQEEKGGKYRVDENGEVVKVEEEKE